MSASKTQSESEAPAKVYQVDAVSKQIEELDKLVRSVMTTYITKQDLELAIKDAKEVTDKSIDDAITKAFAPWVKVFWIIITPILAALSGITLLSWLANQGRLGQ